jgi:hypothetical protein
MLKVLKSSARLLLCGLALAVCLAGCDAGSSSVTAAETQENQAQDSCALNALADALPAAARIAGLARQPTQCDWLSASVRYEDGAQVHGNVCNVTLSDLNTAIPPDFRSPAEREIAQTTQVVNRATYQSPIEMLRRHRELMLQDKRFLEAIGGVDHLPVVDQLPRGHPYVIGVPAVQDAPSEESLTALINAGHYGLAISCSEKISNHAGAKSLYAPWIAALRLEALK